MFCRASNGALAFGASRALFLTTTNGLQNMPRFSRISDTYRRRLRLSSRDVLVAVAVTLLAAGVIIMALREGPPTARRFPEAAVHVDPKP
jgi:hypothetical protein